MLTVWCQNGEVVVVDDVSVAKMSGGEVDVEPYLNSQNTIGHGTATQILKAKRDKIVGVGSGKRWWCMWYKEVLCGTVCGHQNKIWQNMDGKRGGGWRWGKARSTRGKANPRIKSNKTSSHQQITKKIGGYFCGDFRD